MSCGLRNPQNRPVSAAEQLYARLDQRAEQMFQTGLIDEARGILARALLFRPSRSNRTDTARPYSF